MFVHTMRRGRYQMRTSKWRCMLTQMQTAVHVMRHV